jgi:hypothetical protein
MPITANLQHGKSSMYENMCIRSFRQKYKSKYYSLLVCIEKILEQNAYIRPDGLEEKSRCLGWVHSLHCYWYENHCDSNQFCWNSEKGSGQEMKQNLALWARSHMSVTTQQRCMVCQQQTHLQSATLPTTLKSHNWKSTYCIYMHTQKQNLLHHICQQCHL